MTDDTHFEFEATRKEVIVKSILLMMVTGALTYIFSEVSRFLLLIGYMVYKSI